MAATGVNAPIFQCFPIYLKNVWRYDAEIWYACVWQQGDHSVKFWHSEVKGQRSQGSITLQFKRFSRVKTQEILLNLEKILYDNQNWC